MVTIRNASRDKSELRLSILHEARVYSRRENPQISCNSVKPVCYPKSFTLPLLSGFIPSFENIYILYSRFCRMSLHLLIQVLFLKYARLFYIIMKEREKKWKKQEFCISFGIFQKKIIIIILIIDINICAININKL